MWGRFVWWLYHDANAPGVMQTYTSVTIVGLTAVLVWVTWMYASLTRRMVIAMEKQLASSFQPDLGVQFTFHAKGEGTSKGVKSESVGGVLLLSSRAELPIKITSVTIEIVFDVKTLVTERETIDAQNLIMSKGAQKEYNFTVDVPLGRTAGRYNRIAIVSCSDLAGISKHRFSTSDYDKSVSHHFGAVDI